MAVHQTGMMEPMMMMGMIDSEVGINYSTNRAQFPPQAHAGVPNTLANHPTIQTVQTQPNAAIISQLQQPPQQLQVSPPSAPVQPPSVPSSATNSNKPKKPRKKKSEDGTSLQKSDSEVKIKKKKAQGKDKARPKPKKPSDGSKYDLK